MFTDEQWLLIIATSCVFAVILIIRAIYRKIIFDKVSAISENVKEMQRINSAFIFAPLLQKSYSSSCPTNSYRSFQRLSGSDVMASYIENNDGCLRNNIEIALKNKIDYAEYIRTVNLLNYDTPDNLLADKRLKRKKFEKYEHLLIQKITKEKPYIIRFKLTIYYRSPKGKNYYKKNGVFNQDDLIELYKNWQQKKNYQKTARYERSLMSDSLRYDILKRDNYRCRICGASAQDGAKLHVDHIIPVSKGGKTIKSNLQTLCDRCNMGKSNKL